MAHVRVYLGWALLLETGASGLAAVRELARALELPANWDRERSRLYLASPLRGLSLVVRAETAREPAPAARAPTGTTGPADPPADGADSAAAAALARALAGAGARVREAVAGDDPPAATLVLAPGREEAAAARHPGLFSRQSRDLAACLLESLRLSGLPAAAGPRPELTGEPASPGPWVRVMVPWDWLGSPTWTALLTDALVQGLLRYFCPPDLDRTIRRWAHLPPAPEVLPEPESGGSPEVPEGHGPPPRPPEPEEPAEAGTAPRPPAEPEEPAEQEEPAGATAAPPPAEPEEPPEPEPAAPASPAEPGSSPEPVEPPPAPPAPAFPPEGALAAPVRILSTAIRRAAPRPLPWAPGKGFLWPWQMPHNPALAVPRYPFRLPVRPVPAKPDGEPPDDPAGAAPGPEAPHPPAQAPGTLAPSTPAPGGPAAGAPAPGAPAANAQAPDALARGALATVGLSAGPRASAASMPSPVPVPDGCPVAPDPSPAPEPAAPEPSGPVAQRPAGPAPPPARLPPLAGGESTPPPIRPRRRRTYPHWIRSWE
ncbi:MAG: hypothetical protein DIU70_003770 [Bacillota bacterium]